uniref:PP1-binding domain-containing protein n=1 Tax=Echeneis naucrates TaxID=173247 RepID=A0A665X0I8_ECHNA
LRGGIHIHPRPALAWTPPICPNGTLPPLNFSELTPTQFGISVQSFIPAASSNNKSRLAQIKARRRSNIGVRGSPETNSLIRFMAQQRMKTPTHQTPESVRSSPYLPRVVSTLRQKMATFQSVMDVEESGVCDLMPKDDRNIGGYIKTRDYLSGEAASLHHRINSLISQRGSLPSDAIGICTVKKKKQVRFGGPLSPEFFDRDLPPSTPLQKGGTPARAPTPGDGLQLRSLLKTPQRSEAQTPKSQPNLSSPNMFGASPTLPMPRHYRIQHVEEDYEEKVEKVEKSLYSLVGRDILCVTYPHANSLLPQQPEESEPAKRSTRSAAKLASGKMKVTSQTTWCWNRGVDRSLYGSREYASKNPSLSPITERLSFTPEALQFSPIYNMMFSVPTASQPETLSNPEANDSTQVTRDPTVTHILEKPLGDLVTPSNSDKGGKQLSRRRVKGKRLKRQVSLADCDLLRKEPQDQTEGKPEEHFQNQTTTNLKAARKTLKHTVAKQRRVDIELGAQTSEQADLLEEHQNRLGDQAASNPENDSRSSSDTQEENGVADLDLAPSLGDFNLEDVFKPVATRGQHSVRRSMRNKCNADKSDNSAGLAWLPWTSPNSSKEVRRRSRSFCSGPLVQSSLLETQNNDS